MPRALLLLLVCSLSFPAAAETPVLQSLAAVNVGEDQGVFAQALDGRILVAQQETKPVHPASVSKVATTLALLERLGPEHRFETRFVAGGPIRNGRLDGDLLVEANGDPFFVFENAFLVLRKLRGLGLREVSGDLKLQGSWMFNWEPDLGARRLKRALQGVDGAPAWNAIGEPRSKLREVGLRFRGGRSPRPSGKTLVVHQSPPLRTILKALNGYSNNVFHPLSDHIGGPAAVEAVARSHVPAALQSEITIANAAGAGETNRLSPRAAVAILWQLRTQLDKVHMHLPDVLPVNGMDTGTLEDRLDEATYRGRVVGKTGTFGSLGASALVGVVRTEKYGEVAFAVLNSWVPVAEARHRQDAFVRALIDATHADPWDYVPDQKPIFAEAQLQP